MKHGLSIVICFSVFVGCNTKNTPALFPFYDSDSQFGFVDKEGRVVIESRFDCVGYGPTEKEYDCKFEEDWMRFEQPISAAVCSEGRCAVKFNGKWGYIDERGDMLIPAEYDEAYAFSEGVAVVSRNDTFMYIGRDGVRAIPQLFSEAHSFSDGLAAAKSLGTTGLGYINRLGEFVIEQKYFRAGKFHEGIAGVLEIGGNWSSINKEGKIAFAATIDPYDGYGEGFFRTWEGTFVDQRGKVKFENPSSERPYRPFSDGLAVIEIGNKYGYMNTQGQIVIAPQFEQADDFSEGLAAVSIHGKWGYIDKSGDIVISPKYRNGHRFVEGLAFVSDVAFTGRTNQNGDQELKITWAYVDRKGKSIWSAVVNM